MDFTDELKKIRESIETLFRKIKCIPALPDPLISTDADNILTTGGDGGLYVPPDAGVTVVSADAGNDISAGGDGGAFFQETPNVSTDPGNDITTGGDGGAFFEETPNVSADADNSISTGSDGGAYLDAQGMVTEGAAQTLSNKKILYRVFDHGSSATPTINATDYDEVHISGLTVNITSMTTNFSNTPFNGQELVIVVKGTAARTITWGASFAGGDIPLPATTDGTRALVVKFKIINSVSTTVFQCLAVTNIGA